MGPEGFRKALVWELCGEGWCGDGAIRRCILEEGLWTQGGPRMGPKASLGGWAIVGYRRKDRRQLPLPCFRQDPEVLRPLLPTPLLKLFQVIPQERAGARSNKQP